MEIKINENKNYYEEIMYITSNYYIFKKRRKIKAHSLSKIYLLYIILSSILFIIFLFIPSLIALSSIFLTTLIISIYLFIETNYKLKEFLKKTNSIVTIDETGITMIDNISSIKLYWNAIEKIILNKYSIAFIPTNFSSFIIFIPINKKDDLIKALEKYNKKYLLNI